MPVPPELRLTIATPATFAAVRSEYHPQYDTEHPGLNRADEGLTEHGQQVPLCQEPERRDTVGLNVCSNSSRMPYP